MANGVIVEQEHVQMAVSAAQTEQPVVSADWIAAHVVASLDPLGLNPKLADEIVRLIDQVQFGFLFFSASRVVDVIVAHVLSRLADGVSVSDPVAVSEALRIHDAASLHDSLRLAVDAALATEVVRVLDRARTSSYFSVEDGFSAKDVLSAGVGVAFQEPVSVMDRGHISQHGYVESGYVALGYVGLITNF